MADANVDENFEYAVNVINELEGLVAELLKERDQRREESILDAVRSSEQLSAITKRTQALRDRINDQLHPSQTANTGRW